MRIRTILLLATAAFLLLSSGALAQLSWGQGVEEAASAKTYHLTSLCWQVEGVSSGGGYRLLSLMAPESKGSGCCCMYLPLLRQNK